MVEKVMHHTPMEENAKTKTGEDLQDLRPVETPAIKPTDPIEIEVNITEEPTSADDLAEQPPKGKYCPQWMFPARFGRVKVSTCIRILIVAILGVLIAILFILSVIPDSPITSAVERFLTWIESIPIYYQIIAVLLFYTFSAPLGTPVTPLNIACGFLFQFFIGVLVALTGTLLGASLCFGLGKTLLYTWANEQMEKHRTLRALGIAVQTQAIKLVTLTHLSPILPATLLHYTYSSVGVDFTKFCVGTFLGVLPFVIVYVYIGSVSHSLTSAIADGEDGDSSLMHEILWMVGIVAVSAIIIIIVTWIGKRELNRALDELNRLDEEKEIEMEEVSDSGSNDDEDSDDDEEFIDQGNAPVIPVINILSKDKVPKFPRAPSYDVALGTVQENMLNIERNQKTESNSSAIATEIKFPSSPVEEHQDNEDDLVEIELELQPVEIANEELEVLEDHAGKEMENSDANANDAVIETEQELPSVNITIPDFEDTSKEVEQETENFISEEISLDDEIILQDIGDDVPQIAQSAALTPLTDTSEFTETEIRSVCDDDTVLDVDL